MAKYYQPLEYIRGAGFSRNQHSERIRPYDCLVDPVGNVHKPGELQNFDLNHFNYIHIPRDIRTGIQLHGGNKGIYLFQIREDNHIYGWIITDDNFISLSKSVTGNTEKARKVFDAAFKYICGTEV